jgi:hypothetical protein
MESAVPKTVLSPVPDRDTVYVLVHLDDYEIGESLLPPDAARLMEPSDAELRAMHTGVPAAILSTAARAGHRISIADPFVAGEWDEEFEGGPYRQQIGGAPLPGDWSVVELEPKAIPDIRRLVPPGARRAVVAGYARRDCVARAAAALERAGLSVEIHDEGTLPLTPAAAGSLLRINRSGRLAPERGA